MFNRIYQGDCREQMKLLPDESIDCCVTSPPYWGLRDYGHDDQIGLEETPEQYVAKMVVVFREVRRTLKQDGTLWLNLGDSYAAQRGGTYMPAETITGGKGGKTCDGNKTNRDRHDGYSPSRNAGAIGLKHKDLVGIPWLVAFALRSDGWYLRQDIIWHKPNPMPESVTDRCTKSHEYIFLLSKSAKYYYDAEAIAEEVAESTTARLAQDIESQIGSNRVPGKTNGNMKAAAPRFGGKKYTAMPDVFNRTKSGNAYEYRDRRNKRSVWSVTTKPYSEAHFATYPEELITPCILAGCPVGGVVLDPFMGSGTTACVAIKNGRRWVGCELNQEYIDIAEKRIDVVQHNQRLDDSQISVFDLQHQRNTTVTLRGDN